MKRLATALLALLLGATALPATAAPGVAAGSEQYADTSWIIMQSPTTADFYFAFAWRSAGEGGLQTIGAVGKGKCEVQRTKHMHSIMCHGSGVGKRLGLDQFSFDPALRSASMTVNTKGHKHTVRWKGRGDAPSVSSGVVGGDDYAGAGAGVSRDARAKARLFGRNMSTPDRTFTFSFLGQGAGAFVFTDYEERTITVAPDGSYTYRVEIQIPR